MSGDSSDEEMTSVFACRADNILKKQREAYEELMKKVEEEDTAKAAKDEEKELLGKIQEKLQKKPRGKRKARSTRQRNKQVDEDVKDEKISKMEILPQINLPPSVKNKLKKIDNENRIERKRIETLNKRVLRKCCPSTVEDPIEIETEQNVTLKISYLSDISKITVGENEKFSSIISKVADLFKLKVAEITLCLRDEIISFDDTPRSLNVKTWEIVDCVPYKAPEEMEDDSDLNKILMKMQSNDSKKRIDIYAHKLEKFKDIMERYANLRSLPLKDLIFEFDGEKIRDSDTPEDLDMESGSCVDVKVTGGSLKPTPPTVPVVDLEREEPTYKMLDICVLD